MLTNSLLRSSKQSSDKLFFNTISAGEAMTPGAPAYNQSTKNLIYCSVYLSNVYVYAVKPNGEIAWQKVITSSSNSTGVSACVNSAGTIFLVINVSTTVASFDVVRLSSSGSFLGAVRVSDTSAITAVSSVSDNSGNIYITANVFTTVNKAAVLKIDSSGSLSWARQITDTVTINTVSVVIESSGTLLANVRRTTSGQRTFIHRIDSFGTQITSFGCSPSSESHFVLPAADGGVVLVGTASGTARGFTKYNSSFALVSCFTSSVYNGSAFFSASVVDGKFIAISSGLDNYAVANQDLSSIYVRSTASSTYSHIPRFANDIGGKMLLSGTAQSTGAYNNFMGSRIDLNSDIGNYGSSAFNIASSASTWVTATAPTTQTVTSTVSTYSPTVTTVTPTVADSSHTNQIFLKV